MKKFTLLMCCSLCAYASIARISAIRGDAIILRDNQQIQAKLNSELEDKDIIKTSAKTRLQVIFNDSTIATIGKNTEFRIDEFKLAGSDSSMKLAVPNGSFKLISGEISKLARKNFALKASTATIGIRGTIFVGEISAKMSKIACLSGAINVSHGAVAKEVKAGKEISFNTQKLNAIKPIDIASFSLAKANFVDSNDEINETKTTAEPSNTAANSSPAQTANLTTTTAAKATEEVSAKANENSSKAAVQNKVEQTQADKNQPAAETKPSTPTTPAKPAISIPSIELKPSTTKIPATALTPAITKPKGLHKIGLDEVPRTPALSTMYPGGQSYFAGNDIIGFATINTIGFVATVGDEMINVYPRDERGSEYIVQKLNLETGELINLAGDIDIKREKDNISITIDGLDFNLKDRKGDSEYAASMSKTLLNQDQFLKAPAAQREKYFQDIDMSRVFYYASTSEQFGQEAAKLEPGKAKFTYVAVNKKENNSRKISNSDKKLNYQIIKSNNLTEIQYDLRGFSSKSLHTDDQKIEAELNRTESILVANSGPISISANKKDFKITISTKEAGTYKTTVGRNNKAAYDNVVSMWENALNSAIAARNAEVDKQAKDPNDKTPNIPVDKNAEFYYGNNAHNLKLNINTGSSEYIGKATQFKGEESFIGTLGIKADSKGAEALFKPDISGKEIKKSWQAGKDDFEQKIKFDETGKELKQITTKADGLDYDISSKAGGFEVDAEIKDATSKIKAKSDLMSKQKKSDWDMVKKSFEGSK